MSVDQSHLSNVVPKISYIGRNIFKMTDCKPIQIMLVGILTVDNCVQIIFYVVRRFNNKLIAQCVSSFL